jgi:hypothetical protein
MAATDDGLVSKAVAQHFLGGIGKTLLDSLLTRGEIASVAIGRRRLVVRSSLHEYAERLLADAQRARGDSA